MTHHHLDQRRDGCLLRGNGPDPLSLPQNGDLVAHLGNLVQPMGDEENRHPLRAQPLHQIHHALDFPPAQRRRRFVQHEYRGVQPEYAGERHELLVGLGQRSRPPVRRNCDPDARKGLFRHLRDLSPVEPREVPGEHRFLEPDVLGHRQVGAETRFLEQDADPLAQRINRGS